MTEPRTGKLVPYLIEMFRFQAWVSMGKMAHPATGKHTVPEHQGRWQCVETQ